MRSRATRAEPSDADRFQFGENWRRFAAGLTPAGHELARESLTEMLGDDVLTGRTFLDLGSGSGLFSLAAVELGAKHVHSLDYDPASVATARQLKERYAPEADWTIEEASVLERKHMAALGQSDVVYSWGVLHHTGDMWTALDLACDRVSPGGTLFVSIYNDQGPWSRAWRLVKRTYNRLPHWLRAPYAILVTLPGEMRRLVFDTIKLRPLDWFYGWVGDPYDERGMSRWHDLIDWAGGYPFEVAKPEEVLDFCAARGFVLRRLTTAGGGHGCNEFLFERTGSYHDD